MALAASAPSAPRKRRQHKFKGGTLIGVLIGVVLGLLIAVGVAFYISYASAPFVDKVKRPPDPPNTGELPDPNRPVQLGRMPTALAVAPATTPAPGATPSIVVVPSVAPASVERVAATPVATTTPAVPPLPDSTAYLLQVGAFRGQEDADGMRVRLAMIGYEARIVNAEVNGVTFYRVRVGPYAQLDDMTVARNRLAENGIQASVVRQH